MTSDPDVFTDLVFTIPGNHGLDDDRVMALAMEFHQRLEAEFGTDIGLASHGCNDDFETWHSLLAERDKARGELIDAVNLIERLTAQEARPTVREFTFTLSFQQALADYLGQPIEEVRHAIGRGIAYMDKADQTAHIDRLIAADVWDDGWRAGRSAAVPSSPRRTNPYRDAQGGEAR